MYSLCISGGVSFFTYFPTTPSFIVLSLLFLDNIFHTQIRFVWILNHPKIKSLFSLFCCNKNFITFKKFFSNNAIERKTNFSFSMIPFEILRFFLEICEQKKNYRIKQKIAINSITNKK